LLALPTEIRLSICSYIFGSGKVVLDAGEAHGNRYLLPGTAVLQHKIARSAQLLRVCKTIMHEARPILYASTTFHVVVQTFAGNLPYAITDSHPSANHVRHLIWQLNCDMMKHFYTEDFSISQTALKEIDDLEIRCQAQTWQGSFCGEWCDRETFVRGRESVINYGRMIRDLMGITTRGEAILVEDKTWLGRGKVVLRISRQKKPAKAQVRNRGSEFLISGLLGLQELHVA